MTEILIAVKKAEEQAEQIRRKAQEEARDIIRSVEEARAQEERAATADRREETNRILKNQNDMTESEIAKVKQKQQLSRDNVRKEAEARIGLAVDKILEGFDNGHR